MAAWLSGFLGVVIFAGSMPATRLVVLEMPPFFTTYARAATAGLLAAAALIVFRAKWPVRADIPALLYVSASVVVGFPLLTAFALRLVPASHAVMLFGMSPLSTAAFALLRVGDRPAPAFWICAAMGAAAVASYAFLQSDCGSLVGNVLMVAAVVVCGLGYAEGGRLACRLPGWQVICWALVISLPAMLPLALATMPGNLGRIHMPTLAGLAYVSIFSAVLGFAFWYRGLALGGVAAVGQLQLLQPFIGLTISAVIFGEVIRPEMLLTAAAVAVCVAGARHFAS